MDQAVHHMNQHSASRSFHDYLFKDKRNMTILWISGIIIVIEIAVFKYFYPYASYIHGDSFVYLESAYKNSSINTYMIGYSMFLRAFGVFSKSDTALVCFQFLLLQISVLSLLFTIFYFYKPTRTTQILLLAFMVPNPLFLYMSNMVSSDAFFLALSLTWITLLLWIIHRPSGQVVFWQTILLFYAFTVRYNALIYFFITIAAFYLSQYPLKAKITAILGSAILISIFVLHTGNKYKELTQTWQYSPFAGWQWANNAMYAYRYVDSAHRKPVPKQFAGIDNMVRQYFDTTRDVSRHPQEALLANTVYMWTRGLPLFKYRDSVFKKDTTATELKKWATMGPFYKAYGLYLVKTYPGYFIRWFIWPNTVRYYAPPVEFLSSFNSGKDSVAPIAKLWFNYSNSKVTTRTKSLDIGLLDFYPILSGVINVLLLFGLICFFALGGMEREPILRKGVLLGAVVWLLNAVFTISASAAALRFQSFPIILTVVFTALLMDWIAAMAAGRGEAKPTIN